MFEDYTYERLLEDVLNNAPDEIDTRQGSIFYDAVSGILIKIAKLYTDLDLIAEMTSIATAKNDALDARASEYGMYRQAPTKAKYNVSFDGTTPQSGERFYYDGHYFLLVKNSVRNIYYLEAETAGSSENNIYVGTPAVPVNTILGLVSATFGTIYENGTDSEEDESFRNRVQEKIAGPAENGNKQHYKTWCESIDGIGVARIFPLWNGPNTVKAVLIDSEGQPCSSSKVSEVQSYIDPATKGYTATVDNRTYIVGDGLGEGVANLGAHFTATEAIPLKINVSFAAETTSGAGIDIVKRETTEAIEKYFKSLVLNTRDIKEIVVRISTVGAILSGLQTILDYNNLKRNGKPENITLGEDYVPVVGEVSIS